MKITIDNHIEHLPTKEILLYVSLQSDLDEINEHLEDGKKLYIDFNEEHTEWSAERTDPCPDYYGMYSLRSETYPFEMIGDYMNIEELDYAILVLTDFLELLNKKIEK